MHSVFPTNIVLWEYAELVSECQVQNVVVMQHVCIKDLSIVETVDARKVNFTVSPKFAIA